MNVFSKQNPDVRKELNSYINQRWGQLYQLEKEWGEKALRYLLLTNSGGAIATLSFLGASTSTANLAGTKIALFLFLLGIVLVGISTAKQFHYVSNLFKSWTIDVNDYHKDKITWKDLNEQDSNRITEGFWDYVIPYSAFGCFILGIISGAYSLFV